MTAAQAARRLKRVRSRIPGDPRRFLADPRRALVLGLVLFALFVLLAFVVPQAPLELEQRWNEWMTDIATLVLKDIALVFNALGRGVGRALLIAAPAAVLLVARRRWSLAAFALTEALTPLISSITKALVDRPRPPAPLVHPSGASFPSGHSAFAGATAVAVILLFTRVGPRRRMWWSLAVFVTAAMAWSRTYLHAHWLLDVTAGATLGVGVALIVCGGVQVLATRGSVGASGAG
jgi:membrane-associated phospholipid phosphatase